MTQRRQGPQDVALELPAGAGDPQTITTIVFDYGKVIEVERKVVK